MEKTELYETFQKGLTSVNGESYIAKKADVAATLTKIFQDKDTHEVALVETPLLKEIGAVDALKAAGIKGSLPQECPGRQRRRYRSRLRHRQLGLHCPDEGRHRLSYR